VVARCRSETAVSGTAATVATAPPTRPTLTVSIIAITTAVSVVALINAKVMNATTTDLGELRSGQWWRLVSPVVVQPSGWGQLAFNMTGLAIVGAALEKALASDVT
jgi:membrane associated rhomboid family serine protease